MRILLAALLALGPLVFAAKRVTISLDRWYAGVLYFVHAKISA